MLILLLQIHQLSILLAYLQIQKLSLLSCPIRQDNNKPCVNNKQKLVVYDKSEASLIVEVQEKPTMKASEAYDYVLEKYNIKAKDIAELTGKSETDISKFRNGHRNISADLLQLFIHALPLEARAHFNMLYSFGDVSNIKVVEKDNKAKV